MIAVPALRGNRIRLMAGSGVLPSPVPCLGNVNVVVDIVVDVDVIVVGSQRPFLIPTRGNGAPYC